MEYSQVYEVNRKMHMRPCCEVVRTIGELKKKYKGIEIQDLKTGQTTNGKSITNLIVKAFSEGGKAKIVVRGDYSLEELMASVNDIGTIFSVQEYQNKLSD